MRRWLKTSRSSSEPESGERGCCAPGWRGASCVSSKFMEWLRPPASGQLEGGDATRAGDDQGAAGGGDQARRGDALADGGEREARAVVVSDEDLARLAHEHEAALRV